MRPFFQAFAVAAVLASTGCSQPYGYSAASYGDVPAYGYGYPGGYSYAGPGYAYGDPGYAYAPPPYVNGGIIGVSRDSWQRDDRRRYDQRSPERDNQRWRGNQFSGDRGRASPQQPQQRRQAQQFQHQAKQSQDVINELRNRLPQQH